MIHLRRTRNSGRCESVKNPKGFSVGFVLWRSVRGGGVSLKTFVGGVLGCPSDVKRSRHPTSLSRFSHLASYDAIFVCFFLLSFFIRNVVVLDQVKKQLFGLDNRGIGSDVAVKNELRRTIKVW